MTVSPEESCLRVKRLVDLFPNYTHNFNTCGHKDTMKYLLSGIGLEFQGGNGPTLIYTRENPIGILAYSMYSIRANRIKEKVKDRGNGVSYPLIIHFDPPHPDWYNYSFDNPTFPELQVKIFQAVFGDDWPQYVSVTIKKTQTVNASHISKKN